jgi:hypothetical protein
MDVVFPLRVAIYGETGDRLALLSAGEAVTVIELVVLETSTV